MIVTADDVTPAHSARGRRSGIRAVFQPFRPSRGADADDGLVGGRPSHTAAQVRQASIRIASRRGELLCQAVGYG